MDMLNSKRSVGAKTMGSMLALAAVGVVASTIGCSNQAPAGVQSVAQRQLKCAPGDIYAVVNRTTPRVQEWIVGCEFYYTRVLCSSEGCRVPSPKPPCFGADDCFREDPVTLEWTLPQLASR